MQSFFVVCVLLFHRGWIVHFWIIYLSFLCNCQNAAVVKLYSDSVAHSPFFPNCFQCLITCACLSIIGIQYFSSMLEGYLIHFWHTKYHISFVLHVFYVLYQSTKSSHLIVKTVFLLWWLLGVQGLGHSCVVTSSWSLVGHYQPAFSGTATFRLIPKSGFSCHVGLQLWCDCQCFLDKVKKGGLVIQIKLDTTKKLFFGNWGQSTPMLDLDFRTL